MKKLALWTAGGLTAATASGLAGLPHLSASLATLTVYIAAPVLLVMALDTVFR
ncbi:UNVERIFIED_ORG: hypothetical protein GGI63_004641 [Rhizobium esperanzae]